MSVWKSDEKIHPSFLRLIVLFEKLYQEAFDTGLSGEETLRLMLRKRNN